MAIAGESPLARGDLFEARRESRFRKRVPCRLTQWPHRFAGVVLNVSRTGLFVQTSASPKIGAEIEVTLSQGTQATPVALTAEVVWHRRVPASLRSVAEGGIGLRIRYAPKPYYRLLAEAAQRTSA